MNPAASLLCFGVVVGNEIQGTQACIGRKCQIPVVVILPHIEIGADRMAAIMCGSEVPRLTTYRVIA